MDLDYQVEPHPFRALLQAAQNLNLTLQKMFKSDRAFFSSRCFALGDTDLHLIYIHLSVFYYVFTPFCVLSCLYTLLCFIMFIHIFVFYHVYTPDVFYHVLREIT